MELLEQFLPEEFAKTTQSLGMFDTEKIGLVMSYLKENGSVASPGFMNVEGIIIFHSSANHYFKAPFDKNHKG